MKGKAKRKLKQELLGKVATKYSPYLTLSLPPKDSSVLFSKQGIVIVQLQRDK
jgi:hypothetical protein